MALVGSTGRQPEPALKLSPAELHFVARMPLHAITSVYGEAGLRQRLLTEVAQFSLQ